MAQSTEAGEVFHTSSESWYRTETPGVPRRPKSHTCRFYVTESTQLQAGRAAGQLRPPVPPGSTQALPATPSPDLSAWRPHPPLKYKGALCSRRPGCSPAPGTLRWDFLDCSAPSSRQPRGELQQSLAMLCAPSTALRLWASKRAQLELGSAASTRPGSSSTQPCSASGLQQLLPNTCPELPPFWVLRREAGPAGPYARPRGTARLFKGPC